MRKPVWKQMQLWWDQYQFKRYVADYFLYLSQLMQATQGQRTLHTIFALDVQRYGLTTYRGRLAQLWLQRYEQNGGDLAQTWVGVLSAMDRLVIQMGQARGDQALAIAFALLAEQHQQFRHLRSQLGSLLWPVLMAVVLITGMLALIPAFTVPELLNTFAVLPAEFYGTKTQWLFASAQFIKSYGVVVLGLVILFFVGVVVSLSVLRGPCRELLDRCEPWQSYKRLQATYLFALLTLLLNERVAQLRLGQAVQLLEHSSSPWLVWQVQKIQERMVRGEVGARGFATGLLPQSMQWFFEDVEQSQGIAQALCLTQQRLYQFFYKQLLLKAQWWRWCLLLGCVALMLAIGGWHYLVIDEMRRALLMFYAQ